MSKSEFSDAQVTLQLPTTLDTDIVVRRVGFNTVEILGKNISDHYLITINQQQCSVDVICLQHTHLLTAYPL